MRVFDWLEKGNDAINMPFESEIDAIIWFTIETLNANCIDIVYIIEFTIECAHIATFSHASFSPIFEQCPVTNRAKSGH